MGVFVCIFVFFLKKIVNKRMQPTKAATMPVPSAQKVAGRRKGVIPSMQKEKNSKSSTAVPNHANNRYRSTGFERDSLYNIPYKSAETEDQFARKEDKRVRNPVRAEQLEDPAQIEARNAEMEQKIKLLEEALPPTAKNIEPLHSFKKETGKYVDRYSGSFLDNFFKICEEAEKAGAKELKQENESEWVAWLEKMSRRHESFAQLHYHVFRKICEGKLNEDPMLCNITFLRALVEQGKISLQECDDIASKHIALETAAKTLQKTFLK